MLQIQHFYTIFIGIFINQVQRNKKTAEKSAALQTFPPFSEAGTGFTLYSYFSLKVAHAVSLQSHAPHPFISTCSA
jgi:hypothetical protein